MEKAQKIKGKVIAAMFYPGRRARRGDGILDILMVLVVPKFKASFRRHVGRRALPAFTRLVLGISDAIKDHISR